MLAHSVKRAHPEAVFHVVLCDRMPACPATTMSAFDTIISINETADRKPAFLDLQAPPGRAVHSRQGDGVGVHRQTDSRAEKIYYFDPDIVVLGRLDDIERTLDRHSVLLTPHLSAPEIEPAAIVENEISCLKHGVYNLGFLGVRQDGAGRRFVAWWAERLRRFCYDEISSGLFTDQRWVDLAPAFFDDIAIVRDPQYNVATWNLTHRRATGGTVRDPD